MQLIDGKKVAHHIREQIKQEVNQRREQGKKTPHLAAILVGNNPASEIYIHYKIKACEEVGFSSSLIRLSAQVSEAQLLEEIAKLNENPQIDGYIVQLPLPSHIAEDKVILSIDPDKDVDGFHPINIGRMVLGQKGFLPATPFGVLKMLEYYEIPTAGKHAVVLGRSHIVGTPMSILLSRKHPQGNASVTLLHSRSQHIEKTLQEADIVVAALGMPEFVRGSMLKKGAVVIDVGTTRVEDASKKSGYALKGDVHFDEAAEKAAFLTPVPGGVGPMTITGLLLNTLEAVKNKDNK
ncbi:MAG: bifunctional 5,10-methylenetetrahydrofolate dehydrogenase/5,10-methenyltetrahydrofolate cyclohydrolase [Bernardetiaceae bacterium]|nr:bifunctional 5,10-methylenetetrahydrofolate dehydrogenase/5,10-methenyltetrahydrofolate cyclohydrolase [Bernardetiaceae bacterium]